MSVLLIWMLLAFNCLSAFADTGYTGIAIDDNAKVEKVYEGSPAFKAGILAGDWIESIDRVSTNGLKMKALADRITGPRGSRVKLVIVRRGKRYSVEVVRGTTETEVNAASAADSRRPRIYTGLHIDDGNRVFSVDADSPAWNVGVRSGDRILYLNNVPTKDNKDLQQLIINMSSSCLVLDLMRGAHKFQVKVVPGPKPREAAPTNSSTPSKSQAISNALPRSGSPPSSASKSYAPSIVPIEIYRQSKFTEKIEPQVRQALAKIPVNVREALKRDGIAVLIVPDILSVKPEFATEKPRGYHGGGYDNCGGLYYSADKKVFICERLSWNNGPLQENWTVIATMLHECGHALDHTCSYSKSDEFVKAYEDDQKYLGSEQRKTFEYFLQENDAGRSEMFAELFLANTSPTEDRYSGDLAKAFPRCTKVVKEISGRL